MFLSVDVCRRRWKSLRDRYLRHKKSEKAGKKSGSAAGRVDTWRFARVLSFLDPFVTPRETSSNLPLGAEEVEGDGAPETPLSGAGEDEELEQAAASHNTGLSTSEDTYSFCIMATGTIYSAARFCLSLMCNIDIYHPSKKKQVFFLNNIDQPSSESDIEDADAAPAPAPGGMYRTKMYSINFRGSTMFMANRLSFN